MSKRIRNKRLRRRPCQRCDKYFHSYAKRGKVCPKCIRRKLSPKSFLKRLKGGDVK